MALILTFAFGTPLRMPVFDAAGDQLEQFGVDIQVDEAELGKLTPDELVQRYLRPAAHALLNRFATHPCARHGECAMYSKPDLDYLDPNREGADPDFYADPD